MRKFSEEQNQMIFDFFAYIILELVAAAAITTQRNVSHVRKNQNQDQKILNLNGNRKRKKRKVDGGKRIINNTIDGLRVFHSFLNREKIFYFSTRFFARSSTMTTN